jgi:hypothetical protein
MVKIIFSKLDFASTILFGTIVAKDEENQLFITHEKVNVFIRFWPSGSPICASSIFQ